MHIKIGLLIGFVRYVSFMIGPYTDSTFKGYCQIDVIQIRMWMYDHMKLNPTIGSFRPVLSTVLWSLVRLPSFTSPSS